MFKGLTDALTGGKKKGGFKSEGHTLGGGTSTASVAGDKVRFNVLFRDASLGMTLSKSENGSATIVSAVAQGSAAAQAGIKPGSKVIGMDGQGIGSFDDFMAVVQTMGRPLQLSFEGPQPSPTGASASGSSTMGKGAAVSRSEQDARREARIAAAEARGSQWDKKLSSTRTSKAQQEKSRREGGAGLRKGAEGPAQPLSAASAAAFESAKQAEAAAAAQGARSAFQPIFGSAAQGRSAVEAVASGEAPPIMQGSSGSGTSSVGGGAAGYHFVDHDSPSGRNRSGNGSSSGSNDSNRGSTSQAHGSTSGAVVDYSSMELDEGLAEALALLSSLEDRAVAADAVATCAKVLGNLVKNFADEKFHRVRVANKTFHKKVATVPGGLEIMTAAGFLLVQDDASGETVLTYPQVPEPEAPLLQALRCLERLAAS